MFDHFGPGFTLVAFGTGECGPFAAAADKLGVPLDILRLDDAAARQLYERDFVLIRPDLMVAWRSDTLPEDCESLLASVCGF